MKFKYIINDLVSQAESLPTCEMAGFGDIRLYDNKPDIKYPYVNIDILSSNVVNNISKEYKFRVYVIDKNEPYIAYNKTELLLNLIMAQYKISNFVINYFDLDFKDKVSGVFTDINYSVNMEEENECN